MKHPLTLGGIIALMAFLTYFAVNYDSEIFSSVRALQNPALDVVMLSVTSLATLYIGVPVILILLYFSKRKVLWDLVTGLAIGLIITLTLKMIIERPRPDEIMNFASLVSAAFSSFPSDHASAAFIMFGILGHYFRKYKLWLYGLAVVIGFSRIYLGAHFPTDVLAGAFIGILVSQLVVKYKLGSRIRRLLRR